MNQHSSSEPASGLLLPWLRLMRLPTVFTSLTNVLCGYLVSSAERDLPALVRQPELYLLLLSSAGLYLGGMVLNDVFDVELDRVERPNRPIPAGLITRKAAAVLGGLLILTGVGCAALASGTTDFSPVVIAAVLAAVVLLYDALLKNTVLAALGMGTCRFLNVMLGASCCGSWAEVWATPQLWIAGALGIYVFGVTWFAQNEAGQSSRAMLVAGMGTAMAGLGWNAWTTWLHAGPSQAATGTLIALGLIAGNILLRGFRAVRINQAVLLQKTVGFMLLNIIFVDAAMTFCFTGSGRLATLVVILVIPATLLKRVVPMS